MAQVMWKRSKVPGTDITIEWAHSTRAIWIKGQEYANAFLALEALGLKKNGNYLSLLAARDRLGIPRRSLDATANPAPISNAEPSPVAAVPPAAISFPTPVIAAAKPALAASPTALQANARDLVRWVRAIRQRIKQATEAGNRTKRDAGTRMIQAGLKLLSVGIPLPQVKARLLVGWSQDELSKLVPEAPPPAVFGDPVEEALRLVKAGFENIFFVGPVGCGKTTIAGHVAERLGKQFEAMPCFEELPASAVFGRMVADGTFIGTAFTTLFEHGGVFLFDEIFKLTPAAAVALNMALANGKFYSPPAQREMQRKGCIVLGASNSFGTGSAKHSTDQAQDGSFLDRFIGACIVMDYNEKFEDQLAENIKAIV